MKAIYTVTVFQTITPHNPLPEFGTRWCIGWFSSYEEAKFALTENPNINTIQEYGTDYNYAIIEQYGDGLFPIGEDIFPLSNKHLFQWIDDHFQEIEVPNELKRICNFAIG